MEKINIEYINWLQYQRRQINSLDFNEIEWYKRDKKFDVSDEKLQEFKYTGLNNIDFVDFIEE